MRRYSRQRFARRSAYSLETVADYNISVGSLRKWMIEGCQGAGRRANTSGWPGSAGISHLFPLLHIIPALSRLSNRKMESSHLKRPRDANAPSTWPQRKRCAVVLNPALEPCPQALPSSAAKGQRRACHARALRSFAALLRNKLVSCPTSAAPAPCGTRYDGVSESAWRSMANWVG